MSFDSITLTLTFAELPVVRHLVACRAVLAGVGAFRVETDPVGAGRQGLALVDICVKDMHGRTSTDMREHHYKY